MNNLQSNDNYDVEQETLKVYQQLMQMGFSDENSLNSATKYPQNIQSAIDYAIKNAINDTQNKKNDHDINNDDTNNDDDNKNNNIDKGNDNDDIYKTPLQRKSEEIDLFHLEFNWDEFRKKQILSENKKYDKIKSNKISKDIEKDWIKINNIDDAANDNKGDDTNNFCVKACQLKSSLCPCINRMVFILKTYHSWCDNIDNNDNISSKSILDLINNLYSKISVIESKTHLFNDYCHLLDFHANNEEFWQFVQQNFNQCDFKKCRLFMRNHRNRENFRNISARKSLYFGFQASDDIVIIKFLDTLHSYLLHSNINIKEEHDLHENILKNDEEQIEQKLRNLSDLRRETNKALKKCEITLENNTKFITQINCDSTESKNNDNESQDKKQEHIALTEYSFGATYKYWAHFNKKSVFCVPKYKNLKEEMMNNEVFTVSELQWNDTLEKALQIKMSYKADSLQAINRGGSNDNYHIPHGMPIPLSHIMVLLFYCNFDTLQRKFKEQCRPKYKKEPRQSLNERNSEIGHWFSLLKEVCWFYGKAMEPGDLFYHGINRTLLFNQFHARFRSPLSTTSSLIVASNFATLNNDDDDDDNNGIILELGYCELCYYIDVEMMSDYPAEKEKLFFGADLQIQNIYCNNKSYRKFVCALTLFQSIVKGAFFVDILNKNKVYQQILLNMINNIQYKYDKSMSYNNDIPQYIQDLFEYFYSNRPSVWIIKSQLKYLEPGLRKYFLPSISSENDQPNDDKSDVNINKRIKQRKKFILDLVGNHGVKHDNITSYPLRYCVEYIWKIVGNDFDKFKTMKPGEWMNGEEITYNINEYEYDKIENDDNNTEEMFVIFQGSCAPSKTGKHSFFLKVNSLSKNIDRILFGLDLFCPSISFKTSIPRKWFKQSDYFGYTMFESKKLKDLTQHFEWHMALKMYDYKKR